MPAALAVLGMLGAFSTLPPYLEPLDVSKSVEVVDHVVPGLIITAMSVLALLLLRRGWHRDSLVLLLAVAASLLAALWETTSHVPLLLEGGQPEAPWGPVLLHSLPGPALLVLSIGLLVRLFAEAPEAERQTS